MTDLPWNDFQPPDDSFLPPEDLEPPDDFGLTPDFLASLEALEPAAEPAIETLPVDPTAYEVEAIDFPPPGADLDALLQSGWQTALALDKTQALEALDAAGLVLKEDLDLSVARYDAEHGLFGLVSLFKEGERYQPMLVVWQPGEQGLQADFATFGLPGSRDLAEADQARVAFALRQDGLTGAVNAMERLSREYEALALTPDLPVRAPSPDLGLD